MNYFRKLLCFLGIHNYTIKEELLPPLGRTFLKIDLSEQYRNECQESNQPLMIYKVNHNKIFPPTLLIKIECQCGKILSCFHSKFIIKSREAP